MLKTLFTNAGDSGSIPELGRVPKEGNGNPLQYSCLENLQYSRRMSLASYRPCGNKESDMTHCLTQDLIHVSILLDLISVCAVLSHVWLLQRHGLSHTRLLCPWSFPSKNTAVGCFSYDVDKVGYALGHDDEEWSSFIICKVRKGLLHGFRGKKVMRWLYIQPVTMSGNE